MPLALKELNKIIEGNTPVISALKDVHVPMLVVFQDQYVFVYDCLLEALISGDTLMRADEFPEILSELCQYDNVIQKTKLEEQFDVSYIKIVNYEIVLYLLGRTCSKCTSFLSDG